MSDLRELDPATLSDSYEVVDENGDVKAKRWTGEDGRQRVYVRVRRHDDARRFDEFWVPTGTGRAADDGPEHLTDQEYLILVTEEGIDEYLEAYAADHSEISVRQRKVMLKDFVQWCRSEVTSDE